mmetsp:Transcript_7505/g.11163  ORF Transcript_7505/g.11163 Transcript_7505/m.11163 type:complete len:834 (-) Transcript_7505:54-2555(-)
MARSDTTSRRKRSSTTSMSYAENDDDSDEEAEFEFEEEIPKKRAKRSSTSSSSPRANPKTKMETSEDEFVGDQDSDDDDFEEPLSALKNKKDKSPSNGRNGRVKSSGTKKVKEEPPVSDDDFEEAPKPKKKRSAAPAKKKETKTKAKSKAKAGAKHVKEEAKKPKTIKSLEKGDRLSAAMQAFLWWEAPPLQDGCQWTTMEHAGVAFPDEYDPHGVKMLYDGKPVTLKPCEEEVATFFAAVDPDGMHLGNKKTAPIFIKNFFNDFKAVLGRGHVIKDFKKCDFGPIRDHLNEQKMVKKAITDEERKQNKTLRQRTMFKYGFALVDGHLEKVGNYNMEPPGTFRGRGEHPKMGKLKQRVNPEQVKLNMSDGARVPFCPVPGHAWGEVSHDPKVQWLANWKENINNQDKYMQLAAQSSFKGKSDRSKYSKAARLCGNIDAIRSSYKKKLKSKNVDERQLGTAMWVIDRLALRVGGEKDTDEEADTVGCCSLRVEHLHFDPNNEGDGNLEIELEFLGKDSMLFKQTIDFGSELYTGNNGMGEQVFANFKRFCAKKTPTQEVFDTLTPTILNQHLKEVMEGLTAKVFRTYNASKTLQDELRKTEQKESWSSLSDAEKVVEYNAANREVAILCNHQKTVSKAQETSLGAISDKIKTLKDQRKELKDTLKKVKSGKTKGIPKKKSALELDEDVKKSLAKAKKMKDEAKTNEEKIEATKADEAAKQKRRDVQKEKFKQMHLWAGDKVPTEESVRKRIETWNAKIAKMELDLKHKDDNKEVSLGTSKLNYMDPRISVAFCKRNEIPIEKIFSKTMRDKFNWSMAVPPDWEFNFDKGNEESL